MNILTAFGFEKSKYQFKATSPSEYPLIKDMTLWEKEDALERAKYLESQEMEGVIVEEFDDEFQMTKWVVYAR